MMTDLHEVVAVSGAYATLQMLAESARPVHGESDMEGMMRDLGVAEPLSTLRELVAAGLLRTPDGNVAITPLGIRTALLLEAINGGDLQEMWRRLSRLEGLAAYSLVREGMTRMFLENLNSRPGFGRLYFCSPWIGLDRRNERLLVNALVRAEARGKRQPEVHVITRPAQGTTAAVPDSLLPFRQLGASVFLNARLHSKLYIREPTTAGGYAMAIVGSQNLTRSTYLELGIRINSDSQLITQLIRYFWEITQNSREILLLKEES